MKKRVAQWIGGGLLSTISVLIYLVLFQTHLFSNLLISALNDQILQNSKMTVDGDIQGSFLGNSLGLNHGRILVNSGKDTLLSASTISISEWDWDWSNREMMLSLLTLTGYSIHTQYLQQLQNGSASGGPGISTIVNRIHATGGLVTFLSRDSLDTIKLPELNSSLSHIDGFLNAKIHAAQIIIPAHISDTLSFSGLLGIDTSGVINVQDLEVQSHRQRMDLNLAIRSDGISAKVHGDKIDPAVLEKFKLPEVLKNLDVTFDLSVNTLHSDIDVSGSGIVRLNNTSIPFLLRKLQRNQAGEKLDLMLGTELNHINITANRDTTGYERGQADLFRFDFDPLINKENIHFSEPIGEVLFRGRQGEYKIATYLKSFVFNNLRFDSLHANLGYSANSGFSIADGMIQQSGNELQFSGEFSEQAIDLEGQIDLSDYSFLALGGIRNRLSGDILSKFKIHGPSSAPRISGDLYPQNLSYDNKLTLTGEGKVDFSVVDKRLIGDVALFGKSGFLFGDSLKSYTILGSIGSQGYAIEDLHLQGTNNLVSISGEFDDQRVMINKINIIKGENQLNLADTVSIARSASGIFNIPSSVITFNNGGLSLSGQYSQSAGLDLQSKFELIHIDQLLEFLRLKVDFSGLASGSAHLTGALNDPIIDSKLTLNNGVTLGYPSDSASVDIRLTSRSIMSNEIDAFTEGGTVKLIGSLPWGYKVKSPEIKETSQNFSIVADNYRLKDLKFTSIAGIPVTGRATGTLSIRGTPGDTKLDAQLSLADASFDTLKFSKAYAELLYEGNLLTFDTLSMISNWGYGSGSGFLPISLDMIAEDRMSVAHRDMGLDFEFNLDEMPFLSSYISSIDAIEGDFSGNISLSGPFSAPIRNGKIRGHNARVEISVLGNPVTNVHSEVTLVDNTLTLDHFSGRLLFSEGSNLNTQGLVKFLASGVGDLIGVNSVQTYAGEVTATGSIDLTSFFHPRFDIQLLGKEVYYRSTDGLIEAIADADLQFTGQDTLDATAIVPVKRAAYYANFESEESYDEEINRSDSSFFKYSLNTQFASDLLISNDQLEAEFEGELWLLDYGDGIMRFTGTLTVREGGKFYYLGNELDLISGEIIFNSVDFNPQINMEAEIDIDGERVRLILSGDLLEPELVISAEDTQLTQSDILTYLTLNKTLVEVSFDESALDPVRTYGEIFLEKQLSKAAREYIGLDLVGVDLASDTTTVPRFQLGQRLSKNLIVTYEGALQPTSGQNDYDFGFEYQINQNVSVTSKINQNSEVELNARLKFTY